jgi:hypothetical protein
VPGLRNRLANDCFWPILLKKSTMVSTAEKYALEIEIFTLSRGFWAQISRSCSQKRRFQQSVRGQSRRTDFFNRIGRFLLLAKGSKPAKNCLWPMLREGSKLFVPTNLWSGCQWTTDTLN